MQLIRDVQAKRVRQKANKMSDISLRFLAQDGRKPGLEIDPARRQTDVMVDGMHLTS